MKRNLGTVQSGNLPFRDPKPGARSSTVAPSQLELPFEPLTVKIPTAVRMTGIGRSKIYELIKAGRIETVKLGSSTLILVPSLRRFIDSLHA